jgi:hypothetical protein
MTQAFNLSQLANNLDSSGRLDATDGLVNAVPVANGGTGASNDSAARTNLDVPSRTGSNASGTWGISITGNAATATTASGLTSGVAVANLGFTPVQQGTGSGQSSNTVKIGWSPAARLKATVDATDLGYFLTGPNVPQNQLSQNGYEKLPSGLIIQWGVVQGLASQTFIINLPIAFPGTTVFISHNFSGNTAIGYVPQATYISSSQILLQSQIFFAQENPTVDHYWLAIGF